MLTRRHKCLKDHRNWATYAKCAFPWVDSVSGDGPWACAAHCDSREVSLFGSKSEADAEAELQNGVGCCGGCTRDHRVFQLIGR